MAQELMMELPSGARDLDLDEAVRRAINRVDSIRESQVELSITVLDGVVTLGGVVLTRIMRRAVTSTAAMVPGVQKVVDNLSTDADLQIAVSQKLAMTPDLRDDFLGVSSYRGLVTLHGKADSTATAELAMELAGEVPGVRGVLNRIDVPVATA